MPTTRDLLLFPPVALWRLITLLFWPALIVAAAWWLTGSHSPVFRGALVVCGPWAAVAVLLWCQQVRGWVRSLGRGVFRTHNRGGGSSW